MTEVCNSPQVIVPGPHWWEVWRHSFWVSFVQVMAWCLFGAFTLTNNSQDLPRCCNEYHWHITSLPTQKGITLVAISDTYYPGGWSLNQHDQVSTIQKSRHSYHKFHRFMGSFQWVAVTCEWLDKDERVPGGHFKNTYELLNLRALKFSHVDKIYIFQCMSKMRARFFVWNFKGTLWNSIQSILSTHWKIWFLCYIETPPRKIFISINARWHTLFLLFLYCVPSIPH